jgi:hypothetical protein
VRGVLGQPGHDGPARGGHAESDGTQCLQRCAVRVNWNGCHPAVTLAHFLE